MSTIKTSEVIDAVEKSLDQAVDRYEESLNGMKARIQELETNGLASMTGKSFTAPRSIADQIKSHQGFADIKAGKRSSGDIELGLSIKTLTSMQGSTNSPQDGYPVQADRVPGLFGWGYRPLRLLDAMRIVPTVSNTVEFVRMNNFANAAASQAGEGVGKASQPIDPQLIESRIATIALTKRISKQLLDDAGLLQNEMAALFNHLVRERLERDLIQGDGSGFSITGLINLGESFTAPTGASQPDAIGEMLATMDSDGYAPSFVCINPNDHQANRAERSTTDNLYIAGSWANPVPPSYWGVPAVATPAVPAGTVIAVSNDHAAYLDRQSAIVEFFEQDSDNVQRNLVTVRAELRGGLMVADTQGVRVLELP